MNVFLLQVYNSDCPPLHVSVHATKRSAQIKAAELVNVIRTKWIEDRGEDLCPDLADVKDAEGEGLFELPPATADNFDDVIYKMDCWDLDNRPEWHSDREDDGGGDWTDIHETPLHDLAPDAWKGAPLPDKPDAAMMESHRAMKAAGLL